MKKGFALFWVLLILPALLCCVPAYAAESPAFSLTPDESEANTGDSVVMTLRYDSGEDLSAFVITCTVDPCFKIEEVTLAGIPATDLSYNISGDVLAIVYLDAKGGENPVKSGANILSIRLTALAKSEGAIQPLHIVDSSFSGLDTADAAVVYEGAVSQGTVTVSGPAASSAVSSTASSSGSSSSRSGSSSSSSSASSSSRSRSESDDEDDDSSSSSRTTTTTASSSSSRRATTTSSSRRATTTAAADTADDSGVSSSRSRAEGTAFGVTSGDESDTNRTRRTVAVEEDESVPGAQAATDGAARTDSAGEDSAFDSKTLGILAIPAALLIALVIGFIFMKKNKDPGEEVPPLEDFYDQQNFEQNNSDDNPSNDYY